MWPFVARKSSQGSHMTHFIQEKTLKKKTLLLLTQLLIILKTPIIFHRQFDSTSKWLLLS